MNRIIRLDPHVANQIAAGEVIERPANALKELVENALDAGARRIQIDIEEGGKKLLRVRDDGCGMNAQDAVLCLQRHATSKLRDADDLFSVRTLGFRGEAMPSIAAVSKIEITTREREAEAGTRVVVQAGDIIDVSEVGCSEGTEICVRDLFFNTPARFKFLKSDGAEAARISEIVGHLALANPQVSFVLRHNGNESLRVEAGGSAFNALVCVWGRDTARAMLPLSKTLQDEAAQTSNVQVTGFVGRPQLTRSTRNGQIFYVNGRVVKNARLNHAVQAAYEGLLHGRDRYPLCVAFISLPTGAVDVNVHPTKSEVRFAREWEVHHAVRVALRETLVGAQLAPEWGLNGSVNTERHAATYAAAWPQSASRVAPLSPPSNLSGPFGSRFDAGNAGTLNGATSPNGAHSSQSSAEVLSPAPSSEPSALRASNAFPPHEPDAIHQPPAATNLTNLFGSEIEDETPRAPQLKPLAQIQNNTYILCEAPDGLYIVCQHRAHERILADHAIAATLGKPVPSQRLVIPLSVDAGPRALAAVEEHASLLKDLGFEVEAFGGSGLLVRAVPANVADGDYENAFSDTLDELISTGRGGQNLQERRRKLLTMLACKSAIKAGDALAPEAMRKLLDDLMALPNPSICPHGQPILIKISSLELDKKFEREYASR